MAAASTVQKYLEQHHVQFDTLAHAPAVSSMRAAIAAGISADKMVKAVVLKKLENRLENRKGYILAVMPASHQLHRLELRTLAGEHIDLAFEEEFTGLFPDCEPGAVPPLGEAYGIETIVDDSIAKLSDIYFEGGDHATLVNVRGSAFCSLIKNSKRGRFSSHR